MLEQGSCVFTSRCPPVGNWKVVVSQSLGLVFFFVSNFLFGGGGGGGGVLRRFMCKVRSCHRFFFFFWLCMINWVWPFAIEYDIHPAKQKHVIAVKTQTTRPHNRSTVVSTYGRWQEYPRYAIGALPPPCLGSHTCIPKDSLQQVGCTTKPQQC